jgi:hypothetical protein
MHHWTDSFSKSIYSLFFGSLCVSEWLLSSIVFRADDPIFGERAVAGRLLAG